MLTWEGSPDQEKKLSQYLPDGIINLHLWSMQNAVDALLYTVHQVNKTTALHLFQ